MLSSMDLKKSDKEQWQSYVNIPNTAPTMGS